MGEWQAAIDALGFDLKLDGTADDLVEELLGHLPAAWREVEAGFECYVNGEEGTLDLVESNDGFDFGGPWTCSLEMSYAQEPSIAGTMMAGAAYAQATGGILWEAEGGEILTADAAVAMAHRTAIDIAHSLTGTDA
ncbi:hypothetical protein [Methylobacterium marchantiae]|uniref:hypothetical protein n=1 Tax=Methylobacterium marchantiae TaxID=600331 RepID=UPI00366FFFD0